jgi:protein-L-isoaspartate(D-aspartate) O-methyltransferase
MDTRSGETGHDERAEMVRAQIAARGVRDERILRAMAAVPRETFLPPEMAEFAYRDSPLPIECGQTISQPYIVALMAEALELVPGDRVLEIGTGSGYAAAVLSRVAGRVFSIERHTALAEGARGRLARLGYDNVEILQGDGSLGWPQQAPYQAITVAAGAPSVPDALMEQLAPGGRLVLPVGEGRETQRLLRLRKQNDGSFIREDLGSVRFVPLVGAQGWSSESTDAVMLSHRAPSCPEAVTHLLNECVEGIDDIESLDLGPLLERIGDARVVCLGEATHGTSQFYRMRDRITRELVRKKGFDMVAVEADWPDAARVDQWVRPSLAGVPRVGAEHPAFARFPSWMWRNHEVLDMVSWLREYNRDERGDRPEVSFHGLDLYSMFSSIRSVLDYLDSVDPAAAAVARRRYGCLAPWENDPHAYGGAVRTGRYRACEQEAVAMLSDILANRLAYSEADGDRFLDASRNAALIENAERYYRMMYYGGDASWNLRDRHMFDTLESLLAFRGPQSKVVVWAHNSHLGDARATEMGVRGQVDVGQLCRQAFGDGCYLVGFGTDHGTVAAAHEWDGPVQSMRVRGAHPESYERLCRDSAVPAFLLALRDPRRPEIRAELAPPRLERAIGVVYRPESELQSHYFRASLPLQFDEWIWFAETDAVHPIRPIEARTFERGHPMAG